MRPAISKPSPRRNPVLDAKAPYATHENEQRLASGSRIGVDTIGARPAQSNQQISRGNHVAQNNTHPLHPNRTLPHQAQPRQQGSSTSNSSPRQFDRRSVMPPHRASDPDVDIYFNDEDNVALLAIEDSAMYDVGSRAATRDGAQGTSESSRGVGTRPQVTTVVNLLSAVH